MVFESIREHASTAVFFFFGGGGWGMGGRMSSDQIILRVANTLENTTGEQRALSKFFATSKASDVVFIRMRLVVWATPPQYATLLHLIAILVMACIVALAHVIVECFEIHWSSVPHRDAFISVPKKPTKQDLQNIEQTSKLLRESEHASSCEKFASTSKWALVNKFCEQVEQRPNYAEY